VRALTEPPTQRGKGLEWVPLGFGRCYHLNMLAANAHAERHTAPPATGREIRSAVKVTGDDLALVGKVMEKLGYFHARNGRLIVKHVRASRLVRKSARKRKAK
jgi:hypothetical protein